MKKLSELTLDELKTLYNENEEFSNKVYEQLYEGNMDAQQYEGEQIFGKNNRTYDFHDHYASFYLTIADHENFAQSLEEGARELLTTEAQALYDKALALAEKWANMTYDEQDENEEIYDELEEANKELLRAIEDQLHAYEQVDDSQVEDELSAISEGLSYMSEWETSDGKVYEHITKVYK